MLARYIEEFKRIRQEWIELLVNNPNYTLAAQHIVSVNAKIELLRSLWNFAQEGEMP